MEAIVNGEARPIRVGTTVADLLSELGFAGRRVAVELNRDIVPRTDYERHEIADGDRLEIVHFVGGG